MTVMGTSRPRTGASWIETTMLRASRSASRDGASLSASPCSPITESRIVSPWKAISRSWASMSSRAASANPSPSSCDRLASSVPMSTQSSEWSSTGPVTESRSTVLTWSEPSSYSRASSRHRGIVA